MLVVFSNDQYLFVCEKMDEKIFIQRVFGVDGIKDLNLKRKEFKTLRVKQISHSDMQVEEMSKYSIK